MCARLLQLLKDKASNDGGVVFMLITVVKFAQPLKALEPILVKLTGNVMLSIFRPAIV